MMKAIAVVLALALCVAHVQAGPLGTKPSSAGFGRRLLDSLTSGRHLLERRMGRNGDRDRGWKNSGVDTWDEDTAGRHLLERGGRGGRGESGWKDSGADNWDEDTAGRHLLERRTGRSNDRDRGWKDNGADNWGNSWGRHLLERRTGRPGGNRGGGGGGWGGSSWTARDRAYSAAFRNTNAAIEAAAHGAIEPRDATQYARYQQRCAMNMDWDCLSGHRKLLRAQ